MLLMVKASGSSQKTLVCNQKAQHKLTLDQNRLAQFNLKLVCCCCIFLVSSLADLKRQLNKGFLQVKAKFQPPHISIQSSSSSVLAPGKQTHLGKLAISLLSCNFFVVISWKKLLWGMITVAKYLIKQMKLLLCHW